MISLGGTSADIVWTRDFILIQGTQPAVEARDRMRATTARWVVIQRDDGRPLYYGFRISEVLGLAAWREAEERGADLHAVSLEALLALREDQSSTAIENREAPAPVDLSWRPALDSPSIFRYIECLTDGWPLAIGDPVPRIVRPTPNPYQDYVPWEHTGWGGPDGAGPDGDGPEFDVFTHRQFADEEPTAPPTPPEPDDRPLSRSAPAETDDRPVPRPGPDEWSGSFAAAPESTDESAPDDEGTTPVRHASIAVDAPLVPAATLNFSVDLLHQAAPQTQGGPLQLGEQPANWARLDLSVTLTCPAIDFAQDGRGTVTIRRNADSVPAQISGVLRADTPLGEVLAVLAQFYDGTRYCGTALRLFTVGAFTQPGVSALTGQAHTSGTVVAEPAAKQPDLTVYISKVDRATPGRLEWQVTTNRFDGLPARLREEIDLGQDPAAEASALFKTFAQLPRGQHRERIEGFGSQLWQRAPRMFQDVYWALWDHYQRRLTIQFISDEPHLPWELMRPTRADDSEIHPPLALKHVCARWIERWDGYMRNRLPSGRVYTIAPKYRRVSRGLPRAQAEAQMLIDQFHAKPVDGTRAAVTSLLRTAPPVEPVAVLHFAGHGKFSGDAASESNIKLEDGDLATSEIGPEVRLGKACRTLVFFNACEVGASGTVLGEVGGWADALLARQFGGFIAPLWSVDDEDAGLVASELIAGIVTGHELVGEVLRGVREKYGECSPTFYSYLYYGDVTARVGD